MRHTQDTLSLLDVVVRIISTTRSLRTRSAAAQLLITDEQLNTWFLDRKKDSTEDALISVLEVVESMMDGLAKLVRTGEKLDDELAYETLTRANETMRKLMLPKPSAD